MAYTPPRLVKETPNKSMVKKMTLSVDDILFVSQLTIVLSVVAFIITELVK